MRKKQGPVSPYAMLPAPEARTGQKLPIKLKNLIITLNYSQFLLLFEWVTITLHSTFFSFLLDFDVLD